jgi:hypothetical protein
LDALDQLVDRLIALGSQGATTTYGYDALEVGDLRSRIRRLVHPEQLLHLDTG